MVGANADLAPDNTLLVKGDAGDAVTLTGAGPALAAREDVRRAYLGL